MGVGDGGPVAHDTFRAVGEGDRAADERTRRAEHRRSGCVIWPFNGLSKAFEGLPNGFKGPSKKVF